MRKEDKRLWHEGCIGVPTPGTHGKETVQYWVKAYDTGSEYGINGGRISKLRMEINGETVADYDRGWAKKPDEDDETVMIAYYILLHDYN